MLTSKLFGNMFGTEEMCALFNDSNILQKWLDIEAAVARAEAELELIPLDVADEICDKCRAELFNLDELQLDIRKTGHVIMPVVRMLNKLCERRAGEYVHWGTTTQDVVDTAFMLLYSEAWQIIARDLKELEKILGNLANDHKDTLMAGRTHGQHALPITFGYKVAVWLSEIRRHLERLETAKTRLFVGDISGAVGTFAGFGEHGPAIQQKTLEKLGLGCPDISWHVSRDRMAELASVLAMVGGTLEKIATEIYRLQCTEYCELQELFVPGRIGSSTLPHKRNPQTCEAIITAGRICKHCCEIVIEAMVQEHERESSIWKTEWVALPTAFILLAGMLKRLVSVCSGLQVDRERMLKNLELSRDFMLSESIMFALAEHLGRQTAHEIVYRAGVLATDNDRTLIEVLLENPILEQLKIGGEELQKLVDFKRHIGKSAEKAIEIASKGG